MFAYAVQTHAVDCRTSRHIVTMMALWSVTLPLVPWSYLQSGAAHSMNVAFPNA
jgi:hypothetical protein